MYFWSLLVPGTALLADVYAPHIGNAPDLDHQVVIDMHLSVEYLFQLFGRPPECQGRFAGVTAKSSIAQIEQHLPGLFLICTLIVDDFARSLHIYPPYRSELILGKSLSEPNEAPLSDGKQYTVIPYVYRSTEWTPPSGSKSLTSDTSG